MSYLWAKVLISLGLTIIGIAAWYIKDRRNKNEYYAAGYSSVINLSEDEILDKLVEILNENENEVHYGSFLKGVVDALNEKT